MKRFFIFYTAAIVLLFSSSVNAKIIISSQELYEQCKSDITLKDFDHTKCNFFMQGFIQSHFISIPLLSECTASNEGIKNFVKNTYCINPITILPKDFATKFLDWYSTTEIQKNKASPDAYSMIYKMMAEPKNCSK